MVIKREYILVFEQIEHIQFVISKHLVLDFTVSGYGETQCIASLIREKSILFVCKLYHTLNKFVILNHLYSRPHSEREIEHLLVVINVIRYIVSFDNFRNIKVQLIKRRTIRLKDDTVL